MAKRGTYAKRHPMARFERFVTMSPSGCWLWGGNTTKGGYGTFTVAGRTHPAHRWLYEQTYGLIPEGLECDHLCRNPPCVNPDHIEPVTHEENMRRAAHARKTHCPKGHPYDEANTRIQIRKRTRRGVTRKYAERICKTCHRAHANAHKRRKRSKKGGRADGVARS